jgi:hypothetical protein
MAAELPADVSLVERARVFFVDVFCEGLDTWAPPASNVDPELQQMLSAHLAHWPEQMRRRMHQRLKAVSSGASPEALAGDVPVLAVLPQGGLALVDEEAVQLSILISRLSLAIMDRSTWEYAGLRARVTRLLQVDDLPAEDVLRPQTLAHCWLHAWQSAGLPLRAWHAAEDHWQRLCASHSEMAYGRTNGWLVEQGAVAEIDLRSLIRRAQDRGPAAPATPVTPPPAPASHAKVSHRAPPPPPASERRAAGAAPGGGLSGRGLPAALQGGGGTGGGSRGMAAAPGSGAPAAVQEETRLLTRPQGAAPGEAPGGGALPLVKRLSDLLEKQIPGFRAMGRNVSPSEALTQAMQRVQQRLQQLPGGTQHLSLQAGAGDLAPMLRELQAQIRAVKQAAGTPHERATVELVALMFQSLLAEEKIPADVRIWFARLQMPTLRIALADADFFTHEDHPARRLIDRMGACVMGFEGDGGASDLSLVAEIRRVVQVVEAFPETGVRVFKTVLREFEQFLEGYYQGQNEAMRTGVSLAQRIEQREALAVQYTIELRKRLSDVPVPVTVREFLFHLWADVLATQAVRHGLNSAEVRWAREVALDLIWQAGAKTSQEQRMEAMRRLPGLLAALRQGMQLSGLDAERQTQVVQSLSVALATAFAARAPVLSAAQLAQLKQRLKTIDEMMPDGELELDDAWVLDETSHQQEGLDIVSDGGSLPSPAYLARAAELAVGSTYTLEHRGQRLAVRLIWQGMNRQLTLFATQEGTCLLFQRSRLAAFLQAGLLVPVQEETLTVRAARRAIDQISADPSKLLG